MPGQQKYNTVEHTNAGQEAALGKSGTARIQEQFANSPLHGGTKYGDPIDHASVLHAYHTDVKDGVINDGGHTFGTVHPHYQHSSGPPQWGNVAYGNGGGQPSSPWTPALNSPGEGSADIPNLDSSALRANEFANAVGLVDGSHPRPQQWGTGGGGTLEIDVSSSNMAQYALIDLEMGKSPATAEN